MRVFVTGATGFIGSEIVKELLRTGHQVLGLARNEANAKILLAAGAEVHQGDLTDLNSLRSGAALSEAVIHAGFIHDFSRFSEAAEIDRRAIETLGGELAGSSRPLIVTAGIGPRNNNQVAIEDSDPLPNPRLPRVSEEAALSLLPKGIKVSVVRLPQVHNTAKQGLASQLIAIAKAKGVSAYIGEGLNRWAAVHVLDAALLYRLVLEKGSAGKRYHAVGEEGIQLKDMATAIGRRLKLPVVSVTKEEAIAHFGWLAMPAGTNMPASSVLTREWLGWVPKQRGLIADLEEGSF